MTNGITNLSNAYPVNGTVKLPSAYTDARFNKINKKNSVQNSPDSNNISIKGNNIKDILSSEEKEVLAASFPAAGNNVYGAKAGVSSQLVKGLKIDVTV